MSTQTQTFQSYIKVGVENLPINLTATGIRCISCDQFYSQDQIQKHLATHVNPRFVQNNYELNAFSPRKIQMAQVQDPQKIQELWVKSYLPADLPQPEIPLKKIAIPFNQNTLPDNNILKVSQSHDPDTTELTVDSLQAQEQFIEPEQQLNLRQHIKLCRNNEKVEKKKIHVYMNEKEVNKNFDNNSLAEKQPIRDNTTQTYDGYTVMRSPINPSHQTLSNTSPVTYNITSAIKHPRENLNIITTSRRIDETKKNLGASRTTIYASRINPTIHNTNHNHECPQCKGFYCSYCKSSVPPIYRPVPDSEGNYHFHPNQNENAIQFYKSRYYPREDINVCTSCDRKLVQSRMLYQGQGERNN